MKYRYFLPLSLLTILVGCGHLSTHKVGLVSIGDLEGKILPEEVNQAKLTGEDCGQGGTDPYSLAQAVRNTLDMTGYDTLIDVEVKNSTGLFVFSNCIQVTGSPLDSKELATLKENTNG